MLRPSTITFVDTPALVEPFDRVPWSNAVYEALKRCDIIVLVIKAFDDPSVEHWEMKACDYCAKHAYAHDYDDDGDDGDESESLSWWKHAESSSRVVIDIMSDHDKKVLAEMRKNATYGDDLDALGTIEDNVRGYHRSDFGHVTTDHRVRYHDWSEKELAVLERIPMLTSKPIVYAFNMDAEEFANATSIESLRDDARAYIQDTDRDALVLPFAGRVLRDEAKASLFDAGELSGAAAIIEKTIEDCEISHFYTANEGLVAAWAIKLGTTIDEAIQLTNATLESSVTVVEAISMRGVVEAGSVEKALSIGMVRRLSCEDEVEDGDLLMLTPGKLDEVAQEITDSMAVSGSTLGRDAPTGEERSYVASWSYVSLAFNVLLLAGLLAALLSNKALVKRIRAWIDERSRRRERLPDAVRFNADSDSIGIGSA